MGKEIEHKYLVISDEYKHLSDRHFFIRQGYLSRDPERVVRIRVAGDKAYITVKGITTEDSRLEFEYPIQVHDAEEMLDLCVPPVIRKTRYIVPYKGFIWEVDEFESPRRFTLAEIELPSSDTRYVLPPFVGENVTGNPAYYNSTLC